MQSPNYCEWNAAQRAADPTLRFACGAPALYAAYGSQLPDEPVYTCYAHLNDVTEWLREDMPQVNVLPLTDAARKLITPAGLIGSTGKSADCQWSRHILCRAPSVCKCRCHTGAN